MRRTCFERQRCVQKFPHVVIGPVSKSKVFILDLLLHCIYPISGDQLVDA